MAAKKARPEHAIQSEILKKLRQAGVFCWRNNSGQIRTQNRMIVIGKAGMPDILGYLPDGTGFAIEVKHKSIMDVTQGQYNTLKKLHDTGVLAFASNNAQAAVDEILTYCQEW